MVRSIIMMDAEIKGPRISSEAAAENDWKKRRSSTFHRSSSHDTVSVSDIDLLFDDRSSDLLLNSDNEHLHRSSAIFRGEKRLASLPSSKDTMKSDALGLLTINKLRFSELDGTIFGREKEVALLKEEVMRPDARKLIFISGVAGVGKTSLALSVKNTEGAAFVHGKFDQYSVSPYAALSSACRELCDKILKSNQEIIDTIRRDLSEELKEELFCLMNIIPALANIVGSQARTPMNDLEKSFQQLHFAFCVFFRVVCRSFHQVILVLDDLQWADQPSLELLEVLISDTKNKGIIICGVFRSNEVDEAHVLSKIRRDIREKSKSGGNFSLREIQLDNLDLPEVIAVVGSLFSMDYDDAKVIGLANLCDKRTQGNIFFLLSFLKMLEEEGFFNFNLGTLQWQWDISQIERETASTENVVELVSRKIKGLQADVAKVLKLASFLGSEFQSHTLQSVWAEFGDDASDLEDLLSQSIKESFFERVGPTTYRWVHDKVQEAALSLVSHAELPFLQFKIGKILEKGLDGDRNRDVLSIFRIVDLLDASEYDLQILEHSVRETTPEMIRLDVARLSVKATRQAVELSAYQSAAKYVRIGIKHLPENCWELHYDLSLQLHSIGAQVEGILANTEAMQMHADCVLKQAKSLLDKMPCYYALVNRMGTDGRLKESNKLALDVLSLLGHKFPKNQCIRAFKAILGLLSAKEVLTSMDTVIFPVLSAPEKLCAMRFLSSVTTSSYLLLDNMLFLQAVIRMVQLTLDHGVCDESLPASATLGVCVSSVLGDFKSGSRLADLALRMSNQLGYQAKTMESKVIFRAWAFVLHWTNPVSASLKPFLRGYKVGMLMGDTESATYCMFCYCWMTFQLSKPLRTIEEDCRVYHAQMRDLGRIEAAEGTNNIWQTVLFLMGRIDECEIYSDLEGERKAFQPSRNVCRSLLFAILGDYENGALFAIQLGNSVMKDAPGAIITVLEPFFGSISLYAMARKTKKRLYKRHARKTHKLCQSWAAKGNPNLIHQLNLLAAEDAALRGKNTIAAEQYRMAITRAIRSGFLRDAGLAAERYADFLLNHMQDQDEARYQIQQAMIYYGDWGAERKVMLLKAAYQLEGTK